MKIVLIGYRCTGKTAVGKRIAERLGLPFYDTDELIGGQSGKTVREIVDEGGWDAFRAAEKEIIKQLSSFADAVIAAGGGAPMDAENREVLRRTGTCIWLTADERTIVERMQNDHVSAAQRPPLSDDGLEKETAKILEARRPVYQEVADCIVDTAHKGIDAVVDEVCAALDRHDRASKPVRSPVT
jgi:shikimate kinase